MMNRRNILAMLGLLPLAACTAESPGTLRLLNVSYDTTRELYSDYNRLFVDYWREQTGQELRIQQSHGGSGHQARSVIDGLPADVVTLALAHDIDNIAALSGRLPPDWQQKFPENSSPCNSAVVLLVRRGNPKNIRGWDDLVRDGVQVITPNPRTSGGARWNYLAAWVHALAANNGDSQAAAVFMRRLLANVPVLDTAARAATMTFVQRHIGDVLIAWEAEALLARAQPGGDRMELVIPESSILAELPVAVVERNARRRGTSAIARAYLEQLYSPAAQEIMVAHHYRPVHAAVAAAHAERFAPMQLHRIAELGGWTTVHEQHFADGALLDQLMRAS